MSDRQPPRPSPAGAAAPAGGDTLAPATRRLLAIVGAVVLVALIVADPFVEGHPHFGVDGTFAFYAWFGFAAAVAVVIVAKVVGVFLQRTDSYYDQ
ncbi:hypothetical protein [Caenispirillum bisanense]|uniref:hypothetical protein n=1 Tax=Caenispirillum bisanense TaxID=414052 RepID=UPI0031E0573C